MNADENDREGLTSLRNQVSLFILSRGMVKLDSDYRVQHSPMSQSFVETNVIHHGDCREILPTLPDECVDLIVTSPPYAERRKTTYGGIPPEEYVEWFLPISAELKRVQSQWKTPLTG